MRLATLRTPHGTAAARLDAGGFLPVEGVADVGALLAIPDWRTLAEPAAGTPIPQDAADLAPVVPHPSKVICVGLNYRAHIAESGREAPAHPTIFAKWAQTLTGPNDDIAVPPEDPAMDWEAELVVVIGRSGRRIAEADALDHIAGYTVANDISMRTWQHRTIEFLQGKAWDATTPLGPVMVTPDEWTPGPAITAAIDDRVVQSAPTSDLQFGPAALVAFCSTIAELHPGDLILTGTPGGVGDHRKPPEYLTEGVELVTTVEGIGSLRNRIVAG